MTLIHRRRLLAATAAAALSLCASVHAQGGLGSGAPVRLIVGYSAGGPVDQGARLLSIALSKELGSNVVVDNKTGANATLAGNETSRANPDGLTLWFAASPTITISPNVMRKMQFDPAKDLTPIAPVLSYYNVLVANNNEPFKTTKALVDYAKANPGKLSYASAGVGGSNHLGTLLFAKRSGIELNHVPYRGNAPAMTDVMGGQINMMMDIISTAGTYIHSKKVTPIAVTSPQRNPALPDVPTFAESGIDGLKGFDVGGWYAVYGPKGMAPELQMRLNKAINAALAEPDVKEKLRSEGGDILGGSSEDFGKLMRAEVPRWAKIVKDSGASLN